MNNFNFAGKIAHNFIHNRPLTILIFIVTIFVGVASYIVTPKQYNPEVTLPAFQIRIDYPGASAEEVEQFVTRELEEKIADIQGVDKITSMSMDGGASIVNVEFFVGESLESAKVKIQSKLSENLDLRKGSIGTPIIKNINPDDVPILEIGFTSDFLSQNEIRERVIDVMNQMKKVSGVSNLELHGGERKALVITLHPELLKLRAISPLDVQNALLASNMKVPAGFIKDGENIRSIEVNSSLNVHAAENIFVAPGVRVADVASVEEKYREKTSFVNILEKNGNTIKNSDGVFLSVAKRKGENGITVAHNALEELQSLKAQLEASGLHYEIFRDDGNMAKTEINRLAHDLTISIAIVVALLIVFLGFKEAMIVAIAIPLTLGLVFFSGYLFGQSINRITLFALILALGLLVDDAIVIVENIHRHLKSGDDKKTAIVRAVNEVGIGLFLCTFSAIVVFLPLTQITGMMGPYMGPLSFFVPVALAMSLFVAYVLTPFLADIILPKHIAHIEQKKASFVERISLSYAQILSFILYRPRLQKQILFFTLIAFLLSLSFPIVQLVHFKMLPKADRDQYYVYIDTAEGSDLPETQKISQDIANIILKDAETKSVEIFTGEPPVIDFNGLYKGANLRKAPNMATLRVNLRSHEERNIKSEKIVENMRKSLMENWYLPQCYPEIHKYSYDLEKLRIEPCSAIHNARVKLFEDPPGPPVTATLVAKIKGENSEIREALAKEVEKAFGNTKAVVDIDTSIEAAYPKTIYTLDYDKALASGVSTAQVANALSTALTPQQITEFHQKNPKEISFIEVTFDPKDRDSFADLSQIYVKNQMGQMLPLDALVLKTESRNEPTRILDERLPTTYVNAEMGKRSIVYAVIDLIAHFVKHPPILDSQKLKLSSWNLFAISYSLENGEKYSIEWGGEWRMTLENFRDLSIAMMLAFFLVYVLLIAQFRSFSATALIMITVPLALIGILFGFVLLDLFGIYLTATALIGFIALIGLVVKNGILFLEYYDYKVAEGMGRIEALTEAGRIRLQPIVLTSLTAILANLTIVSDPVWSGLAWAIVFGLSVSTVLSLGIFPILYNVVQPKR